LDWAPENFEIVAQATCNIVYFMYKFSCSAPGIFAVFLKLSFYGAQLAIAAKKVLSLNIVGKHF
jgi:hypothetical protein